MSQLTIEFENKKDQETASKLLKEAGFEVSSQSKTSIYVDFDSDDSFTDTVIKIEDILEQNDISSDII